MPSYRKQYIRSEQAARLPFFRVHCLSVKDISLVSLMNFTSAMTFTTGRDLIKKESTRNFISNFEDYLLQNRANLLEIILSKWEWHLLEKDDSVWFISSNSKISIVIIVQIDSTRERKSEGRQAIGDFFSSNGLGKFLLNTKFAALVDVNYSSATLSTVRSSYRYICKTKVLIVIIIHIIIV